MIVLGVIAVVFDIVYMLFGYRIYALFIKIIDGLWKTIYLLLVFFMEILMKSVSPDNFAKKLNCITERFERISKKMSSKRLQLLENRKNPIKKIIVVYLLVIGLIAMPVMLDGIISERYVPLFSFAQNYYLKLEQVPLEKSRYYEPLFGYDTDNKQDMSNETVAAPEAVTLFLSKTGRHGAHIRSLADKDSSSITVVSGDEVLLFYGEEENGWLYVTLEDGSTGWIRNYLVERDAVD